MFYRLGGQVSNRKKSSKVKASLTSKNLNLKNEGVFDITIPLIGAKSYINQTKSKLTKKSNSILLLESNMGNDVIEFIFESPKDDFLVFKWHSSFEEVIEELIPKVG